MTCATRFRNIMSINAAVVVVVLASIIQNVPAYMVNPHEDTRFHPKYSVTEGSIAHHNEVSGEDAYGDATTPRSELPHVSSSTTPKVERIDGAYRANYKLYPAGKQRTHFAARPTAQSLFVPASPNSVGNTDTGPATFLSHTSQSDFPVLGAADHDISSFKGFGFNSAESGKTSGFFYEGGKPNNFAAHANNAFRPGPSSPQLNSNEAGGNNNFLGNGVNNLVADFTSNGEDGNQDGYNYNKPLPPVISKSVYVHIAPPEEEVPKQRVIIPKVPPKKNYQIVFIRAPTPPPPTIPVIPPFPPQSDKTLIYVLHPKLEEAPPIRIPPPPENTPIKPEVYFIRYKGRKEISNDSDEEVYRRRYGRRQEEEEGKKSTHGIPEKEGKAASSRSEVPINPYQDDQSDSSGESSNIVQVYEKNRGKNAH